MKKILMLILASQISYLISPISAQTTLPTSYSFTTASFPNGWTANGIAYYTGSGNTPPSLKFDGTGDWLQIFFADDPDTLSYYLAGNSFSGGTFTVQESVDGTAWTTLRTHSSPPAATYTKFTDFPNIASRYIRFFYTQKVTGNIGLDDVSIALATGSPSQEINIKYTGTSIVNGGTAYFSSPVSTPASVGFLISNTGTVNSLIISNASISGPDAGEFVISSFPGTVAPLDSAMLSFNFTPTQAGTRSATLTIANNDANENPFVINLYAIGGDYATEPTAQATNLTFSNIKSYRLSASFTAGSPAPEGYLVLRKKGSTITDAPVDGIVYSKGDYIGSSQVVYTGTAASFIPNNIVASTDYFFAVFSYNGPLQFRNYLQSNPLINNTTTPVNMMGNYYSGISVASPSFLTDLSGKINPHTAIYYGNYQTTIIPLFESRDTTGGKKVVTCVYSGYEFVYDEPFGWSEMSREHTYPHSWMPTFPADNPERPEYNDQHHLFPAQFIDANQVRLNFPFGEVVNVTSQFLDCKLGKDANNRTVFEPRDEHKGDAARALMYMATCYNGISANNWKFKNPIGGSISYGQEQDILKKWHFQDPPDSWEIARNDFLDSLQGNRNPFIDSMNFACFIDFSTMTKINSPALPCSSVGINEKNLAKEEIFIYPNPNDGNFVFEISDLSFQGGKVEIYNVLGERIFNSHLSGFTTQISFSGKSGIYFLQVSNAEKIISEKLLVD